jgi:hypothetical protein
MWTDAGMAEGARDNQFSGVAIDEFSLSTYFTRISQLKTYESSDIAINSVGIYKDYILKDIDKDRDPITISSNSKYHYMEKTVNKLFKKLQIVPELINNLDRFIYYGSHSFNVARDQDTKSLIKRDFHVPYSSVRAYELGRHSGNLILDNYEQVAVVPPLALFKYGANDLSLTDDLTEDSMEKIKENKIDLIRETLFVASKPLFYFQIDKLKEYVLIDKLLTLLTIKELINPIIFLISVGRETDSGKATELARSVELLINNYTDSSSFLSGSFSIHELMNLLIDNIKVLPDYNDSMRNMGALDIDRLIDKLEKLRNDQKDKKDEILNQIGIPPDLFTGNMNRWEAIQRSDRLKSKVKGIIDSIKQSMQVMACNIIYTYTGCECEPSDIEINTFAKTSIEYANATENADMVQSLTDSVSNIMRTIKDVSEDYKFVDTDKWLDLMKQQLNNIGPEFNELITEESKKAFKKDLKDDGDGGWP